jgi:O-acetylhomoserine (thiol)-lyase
MTTSEQSAAPAQSRRFGFDTRMLHAGHIPDAAVGARAVPIYQTTSFVFDDTEMAAQLFELRQYGNIYTRIGNPTTAVFEERVASLEGATGAVATASGMAAQLVALMTLLSPGDEIVASSHLYGGTITQFTHTFKKLSIAVRFVDPTRLVNWEQAIGPSTRALFGETIGNPRGSILDLAPLAALAGSKGIPLIVDNTFATPYLCRPIEHGATIVIHSATKFIGGHGNSIGGVIAESGRFDYSGYPTIAGPSPSYHGLRFYETFGHYGYLMKARAETVRDTGACLSPTNAFLLLQGLETLSIRMDRHVENALAVAEFLSDHPAVAWVSYAGLPDHPDHALAQRYLGGRPGAVFSFGLAAGGSGARAAGSRFIESLQLFSHLANVGDARSLVIHPASTTHQQLSDGELAAAGVGPELVRLSIGLETVDDLLWDLDQALRAAT